MRRIEQEARRLHPDGRPVRPHRRLPFGPAEHPRPRRIHERDLAGVVDGTHTFAEAARDHREVVLLLLDLGVEIGVGKGDRPHRGQRVEQGPVGVVEGLGPAAPGDGQPEPAIGQLDRRRQGAVRHSRVVRPTASRRASAARTPAELSTAARVSSPPMERFTSSVASNRPRHARRGCGRRRGPLPDATRTAMIPLTPQSILPIRSVPPRRVRLNGHFNDAFSTSSTRQATRLTIKARTRLPSGCGDRRLHATRSPSDVAIRLRCRFAPCHAACGTPATGARRPPRPRRPPAPPGRSRQS